MAKIEITGINHFAISVPDFEASIRWYEETFGFTVLDRSEIPGTGIRVCHMQEKGFLMEIFCPGAQGKPLPPERSVPNLDLLTCGNKHISFGVRDAHALLPRMRELGIEVAHVAEVDGTYAFFIRDNTGNLIEIFEEK